MQLVEESKENRTVKTPRCSGVLGSFEFGFCPVILCRKMVVGSEVAASLLMWFQVTWD